MADKINPTADNKAEPALEATPAKRGPGRPPKAATATAMASAQVKQLPPAESPTQLQRGVESFEAMFQTLAGGEPDEDEEQDETEEARETSSINPAKPAEVKSEKEEEDPEDENLDGSIIPDEAKPEEDEDEDGVEGDKETQAKLYKLREDRRQLRADLEKERAAAAALNTKLKEIQESAPLQNFGGAFVNAKTAEDVSNTEQWLGSYEAALEDFLEEEFEETFVNKFHGDPVEMTRKEAKDRLRSVRAEIKRSPQIRQAMETIGKKMEESTKLAKARYPFVFDTSSKFNDSALEAAKEYPELAQSPGRSLALGRIAVAKLIESGKYRLVPVVPRGTKEAKPVNTKSSPTPSAPRQRAERIEERPEVGRDRSKQRLIDGDVRAMEDFASSLLVK